MNTVRRRRNAEGQQAGLAPLPEQASGPQAIGELLRARREELGQDLRDVSHMLRIRYPYLEAIEGGRVGELPRSEEHTSELQSLMRISYAVFCLKKKNIIIDSDNTSVASQKS